MLPAYASATDFMTPTTIFCVARLAFFLVNDPVTEFQVLGVSGDK